VTHAKADDDERHNILLLGIRRARIIAELPVACTYRTARIELIDDVYPPAGGAARSRLQKKLLESFRRLIPEHALAQENFRQLLACKLPLGPVTDIVGFTCALPTQIKLDLLAEADVDARAELLLHTLDAHLPVIATPDTAERAGFPPPFSRN
jgi:ATP-dependent Lon protease